MRSFYPEGLLLLHRNKNFLDVTSVQSEDGNELRGQPHINLLEKLEHIDKQVARLRSNLDLLGKCNFHEILIGQNTILTGNKHSWPVNLL